MIRLACVFFFLVIFLPNSALGGDTPKVLEKSEYGSIDWTDWVVQAGGIGKPPEAERDARQNALRKMIEIVRGVRINSIRTVGEEVAGNDLVMSRIEDMVMASILAEKKELAGGKVMITMAMDMKGGFLQLLLPQDIRQLEPIKAVVVSPEKHELKDPTNENSSQFIEGEPLLVEQPATGILIDARGVSFKPTLTPVVFNEIGEEIYGPAFISREYAVQRGICGYVRGLSSVAKDGRVGASPLIVKGLRSGVEGNDEIVISNTDAQKIRRSPENLSLLKQCRVVIVMD